MILLWANKMISGKLYQIRKEGAWGISDITEHVQKWPAGTVVLFLHNDGPECLVVVEDKLAWFTSSRLRVLL